MLISILLKLFVLSDTSSVNGIPVTSYILVFNLANVRSQLESTVGQSVSLPDASKYLPVALSIIIYDDIYYYCFTLIGKFIYLPFYSSNYKPNNIG